MEFSSPSWNNCHQQQKSPNLGMVLSQNPKIERFWGLAFLALQKSHNLRSSRTFLPHYLGFPYGSEGFLGSPPLELLGNVWILEKGGK